MPERTVTVASSVGLHARPASLFSQAAAKVGVPVTLTNAASSLVRVSEFSLGAFPTAGGADHR